MGESRYLFDMTCPLYDFKEKGRAVQDHVRYMLARTQRMFKYTGLPETIPARMLELYLQVNGCVGIYRHNGELYAYRGGLGGKPDEYYMPTIFTISNPAQNLSVNAKIGEDVVVIRNDATYQGLMPLFSYYATMLVENDISIDIATKNSRIVVLISAPDDRTRVSAEKYLKDITEGRQGVIGESPFLDGVRVQPYGTTGQAGEVLKTLTEREQYIKGCWYNAVGLQANYNMKREMISEGEANLNDDALVPLVDDMLRCRREGLEEVNRLFGTNITVDLDSAWKNNQQEIDLQHKILEKEGEEDGTNDPGQGVPGVADGGRDIREAPDPEPPVG